MFEISGELNVNNVRSISIQGVPFTQTPERNFIFGEGVEFELNEKKFAPVFKTMVLDADWFRRAHPYAQGILSPHSGMVFVNRIGDEEWRISSFGSRFFVEIIENLLKISGDFEDISKIFGQISFND